MAYAELRWASMRLFALGMFACACVALAPANAFAANPVTPVVSPSVGTGSTVFQVDFRAGDSVNAGNGTYYEVRIKTSAGAGCLSRDVEYEVLAPRGRLLTFFFNPEGRQWCGGSWTGTAYWVRDRNFDQGGCPAPPCVTRELVGTFSFRVDAPHPPPVRSVLYTGRTAQDQPVRLRRDRVGRIVAWRIGWVALRCQVAGGFDRSVSKGQGVPLRRDESFTASGSYLAPATFNGSPATQRVSGAIAGQFRGRTAGGTFHAKARVYARGRLLLRCSTGSIRWSARRG
jgi:hypothetical protein